MKEMIEYIRDYLEGLGYDCGCDIETNMINIYRGIDVDDIFNKYTNGSVIIFRDNDILVEDHYNCFIRRLATISYSDPNMLDKICGLI